MAVKDGKTPKLHLKMPNVTSDFRSKKGSNVLFPGALPLASAGVGGYLETSRCTTQTALQLRKAFHEQLRRAVQ